MSGCNGSSIPSIEQYIIDQFSQMGNVEAENLEAYISTDAEKKAAELAADINDDGVLNESRALTSWPADKYGWLDKLELTQLIGDKPATRRISVLSEQIPTLTESAKKQEVIFQLAFFGKRAQVATPQLIKELAHPENRKLIGEVLDTINPAQEELIEALVTAFKSDENIAVRAGVVDVLSLKKGAAGELIGAYVSNDTPREVKIAINRNLGHIRIDKKTYPEFMGKVYAEFSNSSSEDLAYRQNSGNAFVSLVGPEDAKTYMEPLAAIAKNPHEETEVRIIAIKALGQMGEAAKPVTWVLAELAKLKTAKDSNRQAIGQAAVDALSRINANALKLQKAMAADPAMAGSICLE